MSLPVAQAVQCADPLISGPLCSSHDAQFAMSATSVLEPEEYPLELCVLFPFDIRLGRQAGLFSIPQSLMCASFFHSDIKTLTFHAPVPNRIRLSGRDYLFETDQFVRRTAISPPPPAKPASAPASDAPAPLVQERWHSLTRDGARGVDVYQPVATGLAGEIRRTGVWRTALEEVERRCAATATGLTAAGIAGGSGGADGKTPAAMLDAARGPAPAAEGSRLFARISRAPSSP